MDLEQRVEVLEKEMADLKRQLEEPALIINIQSKGAINTGELAKLLVSKCKTKNLICK